MLLRFLGLLVFTLLIASNAFSKKVLTLYASPNGSGSICSKEKPGSLESVHTKIRSLTASLEQDIKVLLRAGIYYLKSTIIFDSTDSGKNDCTVSWEAFPGEVPILSGGLPIVNWSDQNKDGILEASAKGFHFRQLYVNERPAVRARTPNVKSPGDYSNDHYFRLLRWRFCDSSIQINKADIGTDLTSSGDVEIVVLRHWDQHRLRIASVTDSANSSFLYPAYPERNLSFEIKYPQPEGNQPFYWENSFSFLDAANEWYLDRKKEILYYKCSSGETGSSVNVVVPMIECLLKCDGVNNLIFRGITFSHTTWLYPDTHGFVGGQAGSYDNVRNAIVPAGVRVVNSNNVVFERNVFRNMGTSALELEYGTKNTRISGNVFMNISGNGITIYNRVANKYKDPAATDQCFRDTITNNFLTRIGIDYTGCIPIVATYSTQTYIAHNEISYTAYSGISTGWMSGANHQDIKVYYNNVHHVMQVHDDGAGIYAMSNQGKLHVFGNWVHDIIKSEWAGRFPVAGLYLDQGIAGSTWECNLITETKKPLHLNTKAENTVNNSETLYQTIKEPAGLEPAFFALRETK